MHLGELAVLAREAAGTALSQKFREKASRIKETPEWGPFGGCWRLWGILALEGSPLEGAPDEVGIQAPYQKPAK